MRLENGSGHSDDARMSDGDDGRGNVRPVSALGDDKVMVMQCCLWRSTFSR